VTLTPVGGQRIKKGEKHRGGGKGGGGTGGWPDSKNEPKGGELGIPRGRGWKCSRWYKGLLRMEKNKRGSGKNEATSRDNKHEKAVSKIIYGDAIVANGGQGKKKWRNHTGGGVPQNGGKRVGGLCLF